jgi:putative transposase
MPRKARSLPGGICYHVINRGNAKATVFHCNRDYGAFVTLMYLAHERVPMRLLAYCLMPNHFHLVLWPKEDGDVSRWMHWLTTCHVSRYHRRRGTSGRIWQGRFKAFPIQEDRHLLTVMRYVERNPLRANLVSNACDWRWSSIAASPVCSHAALLSQGPVEKPDNWSELVNQPHHEDELKSLRRCTHKNAPFGSGPWTEEIVRRLGLQASLRDAGRPPAQK